VASITLMTGDNLYALRLEKKRWIDEFSKKYGPDTVVRLEAKGLTVRDLMDEVGVMPFLAEKRLVVVDGVPKATKEEMQALEGAIHPATVLLFVDPAPDKRLGGVKQLMEIAAAKAFPAVKGAKLAQWFAAEAARLGVAFDRGAAEAVVERLGADQEALATELEKFAVGIRGRPVTLDDVDAHTFPTDEGVVWTMTDLVSAGKKKEALAYARRLLERGSDPYGLWAILLSMLRNVVAVRAALDDGLAGKDVAERTGVHPFALRSVQPYAAKCTLAELADAVAWATEADVRLKTGGYRATDDSPQELHALIERFLFAIPGGR
jgi:DNA polymerase-3 subunit delta